MMIKSFEKELMIKRMKTSQIVNTSELRDLLITAPTAPGEIPHRDLKIPHRTAPAQICVFFQKFQNLQFCKQLFLKQKS